MITKLALTTIFLIQEIKPLEIYERFKKWLAKRRERRKNRKKKTGLWYSLSKITTIAIGTFIGESLFCSIDKECRENVIEFFEEYQDPVKDGVISMFKGLANKVGLSKPEPSELSEPSETPDPPEPVQVA